MLPGLSKQQQGTCRTPLMHHHSCGILMAQHHHVFRLGKTRLTHLYQLLSVNSRISPHTWVTSQDGASCRNLSQFLLEALRSVCPHMCMRHLPTCHNFSLVIANARIQRQGEVEGLWGLILLSTENTCYRRVKTVFSVDKQDKCSHMGISLTTSCLKTKKESRQKE